MDETILPDDFIDVIGEVIDWLYTGELQPVPHFSGDDRTAISGYCAVTSQITNLYIFGDGYEFTQLRNDAIKKFHALHYGWNDRASSEVALVLNHTEVIGNAFEHLPEKSLFCQYLVDMYAHIFGSMMNDPRERGDSTGDIFERILGKLPACFLAHVMAKLISKPTTGPWRRQRSFWTDELPCAYLE